ncbi:MAG: YjdF family protein [Anaerolineae bacterium]
MATFTVYFEDPWWVGVLEIEEDGVLRAVRRVFGSEPSNEEVQMVVLREFTELTTRLTIGVAVETEASRRRNPKRVMREAGRLTHERGISTKAQDALKAAQEAELQARVAQQRAHREAEAERRRQKAHEKALARRRGH